MAIAPELVRLDQLPLADDPDRTEGLVFRYTAPSLSRNGVTGRPSEATPKLGRWLLDEIVRSMCNTVEPGTDRGASPGEPAPRGGGHMTGAPVAGP